MRLPSILSVEMKLNAHILMSCYCYQTIYVPIA